MFLFMLGPKMKISFKKCSACFIAFLLHIILLLTSVYFVPTSAAAHVSMIWSAWNEKRVDLDQFSTNIISHLCGFVDWKMYSVRGELLYKLCLFEMSLRQSYRLWWCQIQNCIQNSSMNWTPFTMPSFNLSPELPSAPIIALCIPWLTDSKRVSIQF